MNHAAQEGNDKFRRLAQSYRRARRARRKLYQRRQMGDDAVGEYLAQSHVARRLTGIESRRPAGIDQVEVSQTERDAFARALWRLDDEAARELGGQSRARLQRPLDRLTLPSMQELLRRLLAIGGRQVITFGFADDSHRRVVLTPGGAEIPDDGHPHTPLVDLAHRAFADIHGCIIVIRTDERETVNVYEARAAGFHREPRREIYAAAVIGHVAVYFDAEQARESLELDPSTMTPLPRVPGTVYCDWPALEPNEQGIEHA